VIGFPLLIIPFAIYNMIAFLTPGFDWASAPFKFPLNSGEQWGPTFGDMFIVFSLLMLMFEIIKCIRHGRSFVEHFLVLLLAGGATAEFVLVKEAGNSLFMQFIAICFVDLFAGFAAGLRRARRAVVVEQAPVVRGQEFSVHCIVLRGQHIRSVQHDVEPVRPGQHRRFNHRLVIRRGASCERPLYALRFRDVVFDSHLAAATEMPSAADSSATHCAYARSHWPAAPSAIG